MLPDTTLIPPLQGSPRGILATKRGRLLTFFLLYVTEGIPLGFNAVALAALMRRQGLGPEAIGTFVATLYLPWSWKWLAGPIVDLVRIPRWGHRRAWIVGCQTMMAVSLLIAAGIDFATHLALFTAVILVHNAFAATMDVAIDALACTTLPAEERGTANGLMFAGAYVGNALGGSGVLFLMPYVPITAGFLIVVALILTVTVGIALRVTEADSIAPESAVGKRFAVEAVRYFRSLLKSCFGTRAGFAGVIFAVLPAGAYGLGLALQSNLAVELGFDESQIGWLNLWSTVLAALGCICGGLLSDRFGRRRMLAIYVLLTALPTLWLAHRLDQYGWTMPQEIDPAARPSVPAALVAGLWIAACTYNFLQGLMYGTRTALFMDLARSEIAATQFTAYMSLMNLAMAYSAWWQGMSAEHYGYPFTLTLDAALGCLCCVPLAWMTTKPD